MCSLQRNYDVIRNWERFETGPLTVHEISNNVVCATSKASDQPVHTYSMIVRLLTEHYLDFLSFKGGCTGSSKSTLVKMPHCWKSHVTAHIFYVMAE